MRLDKIGGCVKIQLTPNRQAAKSFRAKLAFINERRGITARVFRFWLTLASPNTSRQIKNSLSRKRKNTLFPHLVLAGGKAEFTISSQRVLIFSRLSERP